MINGRYWNWSTSNWWNSANRKIHEHFYPRISNVSKKYLSVPVSFVSSERVFSICGLIVNKKRCRLSENNIDLLVFLNKNLEYWWHLIALVMLLYSCVLIFSCLLFLFIKNICFIYSFTTLHNTSHSSTPDKYLNTE